MGQMINAPLLHLHWEPLGVEDFDVEGPQEGDVEGLPSHSPVTTVTPPSPHMTDS